MAAAAQSRGKCKVNGKIHLTAARRRRDDLTGCQQRSGSADELISGKCHRRFFSRTTCSRCVSLRLSSQKTVLEFKALIASAAGSLRKQRTKEIFKAVLSSLAQKLSPSQHFVSFNSLFTCKQTNRKRLLLLFFFCLWSLNMQYDVSPSLSSYIAVELACVGRNER